MNNKSMLDIDRASHTFTKGDDEFLMRLMELASRVKLGMKCKIKIGRDHEIPNGRFYFQIACWRMDVITKVEGWGYGGKAYLSTHMTDSELFQIMFGLYKGYWEHEARENFEIDGVRPFGPHISTEALISVSRKVDIRSAKHVEDQDVVSQEPAQIREKTDPPFSGDILGGVVINQMTRPLTSDEALVASQRADFLSRQRRLRS